MIMLCATPAWLKDLIFVTACGYKLQTGSEPRMASSFSSSLEPSRAGRASQGTVLPSAIGQVPAARPFSVKPTQLCESSLPLLSPLSHPWLFCPSSALVLTQLGHRLQAIAGTPVPPWKDVSGKVVWGRHGLHLLLSFSLPWLHLQGSWPSSWGQGSTGRPWQVTRASPKTSTSATTQPM